MKHGSVPVLIFVSLEYYRKEFESPFARVDNAMGLAPGNQAEVARNNRFVCTIRIDEVGLATQDIVAFRILQMLVIADAATLFDHHFRKKVKSVHIMRTQMLGYGDVAPSTVQVRVVFCSFWFQYHDCPPLLE